MLTQWPFFLPVPYRNYPGANLKFNVILIQSHTPHHILGISAVRCTLAIDASAGFSGLILPSLISLSNI
jgi:hypothetical protein